MKIGIYTKNKEKGLKNKFDLLIYPAKEPDGERRGPWKSAINSVSLFGDTRRTIKDPRIAALSREGLRAIPGNPRDGFAWGWVCPSEKSYRKEIVDFIEGVLKMEPEGLHLNDIHFPDENYCYCERCQDLTGSRRYEKRASLITEFILEIHKKSSIPISITLHPDPYHQYERFGVMLESLERISNFFLIPLFCVHYASTYWMDTILYGFVKRIKIPLYIEIYLDEAPLYGIARAIATVSKYPVDGIVLLDSYGRYGELGRFFRDDARVREYMGKFPDKSLRELVEKLIFISEVI
jgi:hypothetical protein